MLLDVVKRRVTITSTQNALVARYGGIARGDVTDLLLLDGPHLVAEALEAGIPLRHAVVAADATAQAEIGALVERLAERGVEIITAAAAVMNRLSPVRSPSAIVAIGDRPPHQDARLYSGGAPLVVIACDVQDPGNLGAIVRVAEAGAATGVVAAGSCADPFGWKALRGSMGSALRLPVASRGRADDAIARARRHGCRIVATVARGGHLLFDVNLKMPIAVLIGGEGSGLAPSLVAAADERVTIPMQAPVESLNAAVTAALVVYEARRQRTH